jgi:exonuclease III
MHTNMRSLKHNFDKLNILLNETNFIFNIICVSETWCTDSELKNNSTLHLPTYKAVSLERSAKNRGGGVLMYIKENIPYKVRDDLTVSDGDKEIITIEIINKDSKNILLSVCYRPPKGASNNLATFLQNIIINKAIVEKKKSFIVGDFNLDCLKYKVMKTKNKKFLQPHV